MAEVEVSGLAAEHLLVVGRTNLAVVGGDQSITQVADRRQGVDAVVSASSGARWYAVNSRDRDVAAGRVLAAELLKRSDRPDGIFCINDRSRWESCRDS